MNTVHEKRKSSRLSNEQRELIYEVLACAQEFLARIHGEGVRRGLEAKAKRGETIGRTRLGYKTMLHLSGRGVVETVIGVDQHVAPTIARAFSLFADTRATVADIHAILNEAKITEQPLSRRRVRSILSDRYYLGVVTYKGAVFPGQHRALIDEALFAKVQVKLANARATSTDGE